MGYAEQHYVPRFLLEDWQSAPDKKLTSMRWDRGKIVASRFKAKAVAKRRHLYSTSRSSVSDVQIERDFLGPYVDTPAALVHQKLLKPGSLPKLSANEKSIWSRFLVAQLFRSPPMIAALRERGEEVLVQQVTEHPEAYEAIRGDSTEGTLEEWTRSHIPDAFEDIAMYALPALVASKKISGDMLTGKWAVRYVGRARFNLLICEQPLLLMGPLPHGDELRDVIALPLSPRTCFLRCRDDETLARALGCSENAFVREINGGTMVQATTYVYATDDLQRSFVAEHLRK